MTAATIRQAPREVLAGHGRPGDFRHRAACRSQDVDPEVFFPVAEAGPELARQVEAAKAVCAGCPVRSACLAWALEHQPDGIAGGLTEQERRQENARRRGRPSRRQVTAAARPARSCTSNPGTSKGEDAPAATGAPSQVFHNNALAGTRVTEGHRS